MTLKKTVRDLDVEGKSVLLRIDGNVPISNGRITDDTRLEAALPTIKYLLEKKAKVILLTHLGRPKGTYDAAFSLAPLKQALTKKLDNAIFFCPQTVGEKAKAAVANLKEGQLLILENTRFNPGEKDPETYPEFTKQLASFGQLFVNDAFASCHRSHASVTGLAKELPSAIGFLIEKELKELSFILSNITRPFHAIIGGAKIGTKTAAIKALVKKVDALFIGGGMAYTFLKAQGIQIGDSIVDDSMLDIAKEIIYSCKKHAIALFLPTDVIVTSDLNDPACFKTVKLDKGIEKGFEGVDLGPESTKLWQKELSKAATIFWNGPLGIFENLLASKGTTGMAAFLSKSSAKTVLGGGDSVAAIKKAGIDSKKFNHLSTGGGATLEYIELETLPGIEAIDNKS